ncbi:hypothetical protein C0J52_07494 [Blattella germanica]|nr:hypothetical protein C0J52_07494 [Blattella germanica]
MCHVDLPLPAAVRISAVSVVVCWWCGKVFPLLLSPLFVILAPLNTPIHICCCDQGIVLLLKLQPDGHQQSCLFGIMSGHPFYRTTCIP